MLQQTIGGECWLANANKEEEAHFSNSKMSLDTGGKDKAIFREILSDIWYWPYRQTKIGYGCQKEHCREFGLDTEPTLYSVFVPNPSIRSNGTCIDERQKLKLNHSVMYVMSFAYPMQSTFESPAIANQSAEPSIDEYMFELGSVALGGNQILLPIACLFGSGINR